jgi:hypothetical protein
MANLRWIALGLALMILTACGGDDSPWKWGGAPSAGANSPFQAHHQGDPP